MNRLSINGRLTLAPVLKELDNNNAQCTFFIANDIHFGANKKTGFFKVTAWGQQARIIAEHAKVGTELFISGRLEQYRYEDEKGKTVYDNSIVVEQFDFGSRPAAVDKTA